jgi:hypothetical protein
MMKTVSATLCLGFLASSPSLAQDLYRCDLADGRTVYQSDQCVLGAQQTPIDLQNLRREQFRKARELEREQKRQKTGAVKTAG